MTDVRLDAATLEWVASKLEGERGHLSGAGVTARWGAMLRELRALAAEARPLDERLAADRRIDAAARDLDPVPQVDVLTAEASSRPPALSDWVAACEGTQCRTLSLAGDFVTVDVAESGREALVFVWRTDREGDMRRRQAAICSTPAELRAALERLAKAAGS